jgi:adenosylcobinamide-phosphate synthase
MTTLLVLTALTLDTVLGEPRRWHPLAGFGRLAQSLESRLNGGASSRPRTQKVRGIVALAMIVTPWVALVAVVPVVAQGLYDAVAIGVLYFSLGHQSLREHALQVFNALRSGPLSEARERVSLIVSRDTAELSPQAVALATVESVLENGSDAVFATLFWFLVGGAPAALLHRLVNTLDAMWGYRTPRYQHFGWAAARCDDLLNFLPARLTALTYALIGHTRHALQCWRSQAATWKSPNAGPVMAAGAGAIGVMLGGGASYHGHWSERPALGIGQPPDAMAIPAALRLVRLGVLSWVIVLALWEVSTHA